MQKYNSLLFESIKNLDSYYNWEKSIIQKLCNINKKNLEKNNKKIIGDLFEYLSYYILKFHPYYRNYFDEVYLFEQIPHSIIEKLKLPSIDKGIDILAVKDNNYYGIQCKFRSNKERIIPWKDLSTFPALSFTCNIKKGIFITNCESVCNELLDKDNIINICGKFWDTIDNNFFIQLKLYLDSNLPFTYKKYYPYDYQKEIINISHQHYSLYNKGKLIMPCGTGKSLTSYFIIENLGFKNIIVVVPSLLLLSQFFLEWSKQRNFNALLIGSDVSTEAKDVNGMIIEKDKDLIKEWIKKYNEKIIFTTYQSSKIVKKCLSELNQKFDICIYDEAHKTVGVKGGQFNILLDDNFLVDKRLFMTGTPKIYQGRKSTNNIYCMDDENMYGKTIYEMSISQAINKNLLTDYQIITPITNDKQIEKYMEINKIIIENNEEYSSNSIASALLLIKSINKYNLHKILTYHSNVSNAKKFSNLLIDLSIKFNLDLKCFWIDGTFTMRKRNKIFDEFIKNDRAIICSARVLNEGINIKCIDTVVFVNPRYSIIDITQCVGRCLRLYEGKTISNILIPILIDDDEEDGFDNLLTIINSLGTKDDAIIEYFKDKISSNHKNNRKINWNITQLIEEELPEKIDINNWYNNIETKIHYRFNKWHIRYNEVQLYLKENKKYPTTRSTDEYIKSLGYWCRKQRKNYKKNKIKTERIELLEKLDEWCWNYNEDKEILTWKETYVKLIEWINMNNKLPLTTSEDKIEKKLGRWCSSQKSYFNNNELDEDKIELLNYIEGWYWKDKKIEKISWEETYKKLYNWTKLNDCLPQKQSKNDEEKFIGSWCSHQRDKKKHNKLTEEEIKQLENIEMWAWDLAKKNNEETWNNNYNKLKEWIKQNDNIPSSTSKDKYEYNLFLWCYKQKNNKIKLNQERILMLQNLSNWIWDKRNDKELNKWNENYDNLIKFFNQFNKTPSPKDNNFLNSWYKGQKRRYNDGKLNKEKKEKLKNIDSVYFI